MATATMTRPAPAAVRPSRDASPQDIIAKARSAPATFLAAARAALATSALMWAAFTPLDWGPLGWICLVPLCCLVRIERPTRAMLRAAYLGSLLFWIPALQWMRLGDVTMYGAWILLSLLMAAYSPLFVGVSRIAVHRLRVPFVAAIPLVWTGLELARAHLFTGFGWYFLGHTQYRWAEIIQIADLFGAYGVSFVLALTSACTVAILPDSWLARAGLMPPVASERTRTWPAPATLVPVLVCAIVFAAVLSYGYWRRSEADFQAGPRIGLVQANFTASARMSDYDLPEMYRVHDALTGIAVRQQPDLIVWPEGMFPYPNLLTSGATDVELAQAHPQLGIKRLRSLEVPKVLRDISQRAAASLIIGITSLDVQPDSYRFFNSAQFVTPEGLGGRYDKIHRVVFGEYIPFVEWFPFLQGLTPYRGTFGIAAGTQGVTFSHKGVRYAPVICFEDTVPHVVRGIVAGSRERVDVLVNLTNDGWFHGSSEHDQHLITAAFRSVELRTPMVRAVNTGISAVIDGDGVIRSRAKDRFEVSKQVEAVLVEDVPLDRRTSLYAAGGDWFAGSCLAATLYFAGFGLLSRWLRRSAGPTAAASGR